MVKSNLRLVTPDSDLRTVTLRRLSNREMGRDREHLAELEVERLIKAAKGNRWGQRDATMILIGFRHGLRVSELCGLQWSSIEFQTGAMHVRRAKGGEAATHPLLGDELRALRELKRQSASPFVFASERAGPFTPSGFAKLLARAGDEARWGSRSIPTCSGMLAATPWPIRASIPEPCRPISGIARLTRRRAMRR
jgi:integrase